MEVINVIHKYSGVQGLERSCGVEIFPSRDGVPLVIISQLPDVEGSVDVLLECIAAEVLEKHLPTRIGLKSPFHCIEHYPHEEGSALSETFDLVTFADYDPLKRWVRGILRLSLGKPSRVPFGRKQLNAMIGTSYVWSFVPSPRSSLRALSLSERRCLAQIPRRKTKVRA